MTEFWRDWSALVWVTGASLAGVLPAQGLPGDLDAALARAFAADREVVVLVTGSDWNAPSRVVLEKVLADRRFVESLTRTHEVVHIDLVLKGQSSAAIAAREAAVAAFRRLAVWRHDQIPAAIFLSPDGLIRARTRLLEEGGDKSLLLLREVAAAAAQARAAPRDPGKAQQHVIEGVSLMQQEKTSEALVAGLAAVEDDPTNPSAWDLVASAQGVRIKGSEVDAARRALAVGPLVEGADERTCALVANRWLRLGLGLEARKRNLEAIYCYRQAMASGSGHYEGGLRSAALSLKLKDLAGACRDANEVLRRDFANAEALDIRMRALPSKWRQAL